MTLRPWASLSCLAALLGLGGASEVNRAAILAAPRDGEVERPVFSPPQQQPRVVVPRPYWTDFVRLARWLVYRSDFGAGGTLCGSARRSGRSACEQIGDPFGNVFSVSDGNQSYSSGTIYVYQVNRGPTALDLAANPTVSVTFSEKALNDDNGPCKGHMADHPPCARLTIAGKMTKVPAEREAEARSFLFARHPWMKTRRDWSAYWIDPRSMSFFFVFNYWPGQNFTVQEWYAADPLVGAAVAPRPLMGPQAPAPLPAGQPWISTTQATPALRPMTGALPSVPRPHLYNYAKMARWLLYMSDYGTQFTLCRGIRMACDQTGDPFGSIVPVSDGNATFSSGTVVVHRTMKAESHSKYDLDVHSTVSVTFSEKALGDRGSCRHILADDPWCARLTIAGKMTMVPKDREEEAISWMLAKHPDMVLVWPRDFYLYWIAPEDIYGFFVLDTNGRSHSFTIDSWYQADPLK